MSEKNRKLFTIFFKIGLGTFGGGYAMIPMIEHEVVDKAGWLTREEFIDLMAVAQTSPGVSAVNFSGYIGHKIGGIRSAIIASIGCVLPSVLIILSIAALFRQFAHIPWVEYAFRGIRPVVVALIATPVFTMARAAKLGWSNCWIPIVSLLLIYCLGVSPIYVILCAGLGGYLYGRLAPSTHTKA